MNFFELYLRPITPLSGSWLLQRLSFLVFSGSIGIVWRGACPKKLLIIIVRTIVNNTLIFSIFWRNKLFLFKQLVQEQYICCCGQNASKKNRRKLRIDNDFFRSLYSVIELHPWKAWYVYKLQYLEKVFWCHRKRNETVGLDLRHSF